MCSPDQPGLHENLSQEKDQFYKPDIMVHIQGLSQENGHESETNLGYIMRLSQKQKFGGASSWPTPMVLATQEAKARDAPKPVSSRPMWQHKENLLVSRSVGSGVARQVNGRTQGL